MITNQNPYLLNVVPIFNTIGGVSGEDSTTTTSITAITNLIDTTIYRGSFNTLKSYNSGSINVSDPLYVTSGVLAVGQEGVSPGFACDINGNLNVNGNIQYSGDLIHLSDRRFKQNITDISSDEALNSISRLKGRSFEWKVNSESDIGFIAQELGEVFPEAVHEDSEGFLRISPLKLLPYLVESIKALKARIEVLENAIPVSNNTPFIRSNGYECN